MKTFCSIWGHRLPSSYYYELPRPDFPASPPLIKHMVLNLKMEAAKTAHCAQTAKHFQGAVLYGLSPDRIRARRARKSYGLRLSMLQSDYLQVHRSAPAPADVFTNREDGRPWVWLFSPLVAAGDPVKSDAYYLHEFEPLVTTADQVDVQILASDERVTQSVCSSRVGDQHTIGFIRATSLPQRGNRGVQVKMYLGLTQMEFIVKVLSSGFESRVNLVVET
ncbi:hypothetical protein BDK51DRAFT_41014 [Blyttiomyces helicus]|uniref:Uncharacterized protein n=1 Tax=Blyttiomyces helicus TaxID=388810 RepID=A0A4P9WAE6_9FUNG|nr:hypothetical protein BDK51DRAFT_41014 [Blyttiomyces helicus]|eukprot:RKO88525.1 hypothetical protein BDK51DRAFT_41014 [Blyttiomyces helicus]